MKNEKVKIINCTPFTTLLTIAFIVLKLCNVINWSWVWVLAPLWIPFAIWLIVVLGILIYSGVIELRG